MRILTKDKTNKSIIRSSMQGIRSILPQIALPLGVVMLVLFFSILTPRFISQYNILNISRQLVTLALLACGITYVLVSGGVDLSVGSNMALVSVITGLVLVETSSVALSVVAGVFTGVLLGAINGIIVAVLRVQAFVVTLGTMSIATGVAMLISDGNPIGGLPEDFAFIGNANVWGIPAQVVITAVVLAISYVLLQKTTYGSYIYATGGNEKAAILSGVKTVKVKFIAFVFCGLTAALASIIATSRAMTAQPTLGTDMGMQAIAAAIIGGASMSGGRGSLRGTIIGVLFISVLYSGLNFLKVSTFVQDVLIGVIIIASAWLDVSRRRRVG